MASAKISILIDESLLSRLDRLVASRDLQAAAMLSKRRCEKRLTELNESGSLAIVPSLIRHLKSNLPKKESWKISNNGPIISWQWKLKISLACAYASG